MQVPVPPLVPPVGTWVIQKLPTGGSVRSAGVGGDGLGAGIRQQRGLQVREVDEFSRSGPAVRRVGGA